MTSTAALLALARLRGEPAAVLDPAADMAGALAFLNAERARRERRPSADPALDRAAQSRADEVAAADDLDALESSLSIGDRAIREGYETGSSQEIVLIGGDSFGARLERLRASDPAAFAEADAAGLPRPRRRGRLERRPDRPRPHLRAVSAEDDFAREDGGVSGTSTQVRARSWRASTRSASARRLPAAASRTPSLDQAAQAHAEDMIRALLLRPREPGGRLGDGRACGASAIRPRPIGENIAEGQGSVGGGHGRMDAKPPAPRPHPPTLLPRDRHRSGVRQERARLRDRLGAGVRSPRGGESVRPRRRT